MGERDMAQHEIRAARTRMSELAEEFGERLSTESLKRQAKQIAGEQYTRLKARAKETAMEKGVEMREKVVRSPRSYTLLGAALGAWAGAQIYKRFFRGRPVQDAVVSPTKGVGEGIQDAVVSAKESVGEAFAHAKQGAGQAVEDVKQKASELAGKVPSPKVVAQKANDWYARSVGKQPVGIGLGAFAIGLTAAFLIPVSEGERKLTAPVRKKAKELIATLGEQAASSLQGEPKEDAPDEAITEPSSMPLGEAGYIPQPLH